MKDDMPLRIQYNNCLDLCGAVIKRAREDYTYALYQQLKGVESYKHPVIGGMKCNTKAQIKKYENFFTGEGIEFWGQGMINGDYIMECAKKEAIEKFNAKKNKRGKKDAGQGDAILDVADKND